MWTDAATRACALAAASLVFAGLSRAADKEKIVWKSIPDGILQIDGRAPKIWNLYHTGKKLDPLLLQFGGRAFVIYVKNQEVYEIKPEQLEHKGQDLLWREADRPVKSLATAEWSTRDVGSAWRVRVKLADEGRSLDIQIPQMPDLRGLY